MVLVRRTHPFAPSTLFRFHPVIWPAIYLPNHRSCVSAIASSARWLHLSSATLELTARIPIYIQYWVMFSMIFENHDASRKHTRIESCASLNGWENGYLLVAMIESAAKADDRSKEYMYYGPLPYCCISYSCLLYCAAGWEAAFSRTT